mgnify:CR=1 FL=1
MASTKKIIFKHKSAKTLAQLFKIENNQDFYEIFIQTNISYEESETPIYNQILDQEAIELHKLSKIIQ